MKNLIILVWTFATAFALPSEEIKSKNLVGRPEGRISRGHNATERQFPYQVGLSIKAFDLKYYSCGGCLLSNVWVLTVAHCTVNATEVTVFLGTTNRRNKNTVHIVSARNVINHKNYERRTKKHDIALIRIPYTEYTDSIQPVKLPIKSRFYCDYVGFSVTASGWGYTSDTSDIAPDILQWTLLNIVPNSVCQSRLMFKTLPSFICADTIGGVNTCDGDSGGPIVLTNSKTLIGLILFGATNCTADYPSINTRVTSYLQWIEYFTGISNNI